MGWGSGDDDDDESGRTNARAIREAENGVRQARRLAVLIGEGLAAPAAFRLSTSTLCELNQHAVEGVTPTAGRFRERSDLEILGSRHVLLRHEDMPGLVTEACRLVHERWEEDPLFLAAYVLWRICWIHPFEDGNGRTARAASYVVLSVRLGFELPGRLPIPARIKHAPIAYMRALEAADAAWSRGLLDISVLQELLAFYLEAQLEDAPPSLPP